MRVIGRRYDNQQVVAVTCSGDRIASIESADEHGDATDISWLSPGFVDLQINGYGGQEFNDFALTVDKVHKISRALDACGVTSYCPTATTHSFELLSHAMRTIADACEEDVAARSRIAGIHLEGPYLSAEDGPRGAHPREHCRVPDWDEFQRLQDASRGRIRILTMSPEYEGSEQFIANVVDSGVVVAIGHTAANSAQIRRAVDAGATMSTHLGNGAHGQLRRHPNYIWDQLAEDRLTASLIVDGHHLPAEVVKSFVRAKTPERCVLVSDITGLAGMPPGRHENPSIGAVDVLEDGRLVVAGQRQFLAGASLPIGVGVANVQRMAGVSLAQAIEMATRRPSAIIGQTQRNLAPGARADLVLFDMSDDEERGARLSIRATINRGEVVYGNLQSR